MRYIVFEVGGKAFEITAITREAFDTLTRGIEPDCYTGIEFYTLEEYEKSEL
ncbi:MAG: hypothetical protein QM642_01800 [Edaphocola sp.]